MGTVINGRWLVLHLRRAYVVPFGKEGFMGDIAKVVYYIAMLLKELIYEHKNNHQAPDKN